MLPRILKGRFGVVFLFIFVFCCVALLTRVALLATSYDSVSWSYPLVGSFLLGLVYDIGAASFFGLPILLLTLALPKSFYRWGWLKWFWTAVLFVSLYLLLFGAVAEWFFWDEFGVRFNFIAVDYLVYTQEVLGNIRESYPMPLIFVGLFAATALGFWLLLKTGLPSHWLASMKEPRKDWKQGLAVLALLVLSSFVISEERLPEFKNNYNRELAKNGLWSLFAAFGANQLDYDRFYPGMGHDTALKRVQANLVKDGYSQAPSDASDLLRQVAAPSPALPEKHLNVVQITVESLSGEFLARFGSKKGITPNLDRLLEQSLVFDRFYATGNRTDRGMEALTLSVPPTPGRSLVKRPHNENLFTLGSVFRSRGYDTAFIYGGYGYFDNMNYFFGENGYRVIDRNAVDRTDITFANVWGACDEDLFRWTLREADKNATAQKPFFFFVMTTSNHRPYTFPEGKIDLPSKVSGRDGAVKYTDYAIGAFLEAASKKPWYKDTVFVIVADHCASSAGKAELPVARYHIPLIIFSPGGQLPKGAVDTLCGQVDYAPTLLALLNWSYKSRFFGWNALSDKVRETGGRAFIGNYQKLGYLTEKNLSVLKPVMKFHQETLATPDKASPVDQQSLDDAIAFYEAASWQFKQTKQADFAQGPKPYYAETKKQQ